VPSNGLKSTLDSHYAWVQRLSAQLTVHGGLQNTVVVAVESDQVREALVAMLGANDHFRVVAETNNADTALEAARRQRPRLVLIDPELSNCGGWWVIQQIRSEQLACVVVALGRHANGSLAQIAGAHSYVQIGTSPRDLLSAIEAAMVVRTSPVSGAPETEEHQLPDTHAVLDKPALVDL
jgi:DNA-binding NarL/FixJ family response regulator